MKVREVFGLQGFQTLKFFLPRPASFGQEKGEEHLPMFVGPGQGDVPVGVDGLLTAQSEKRVVNVGGKDGLEDFVEEGLDFVAEA